MFKDWGFLITEMIVLLILAALLGLLVGWILWGRRGQGEDHSDLTERDNLRQTLHACEALQADKDARITTLEAELEAEREMANAASMAPGFIAPPETAPEPVNAEPESVPEPAEDLAPVDKDFDGDGVIEGADEGTRPQCLTEARNGSPDDLKQIKGIGPKLETLCNTLGFFHFDQIANWTADEVAWVDANLAGFKGRVSRDKWVEQAQILAGGGETAFSQKVEKGGVYDK